ncbi:MAG: ABC transporter ATP-binding protein [Alphaproteobacteria bacterium]
MSKKQKNTETHALIKRLVRDYLSSYRGSLFVAIFFMAFASAMTAAVAGLMQPVLDDVLYGKKEELIIPVACGLLLAFAARGITTYVHTVMMNKIGQSIVADVQRDLFSHFMRLDLSFFHANPSGHLISRVVNDVNVMRSAVTDSLTGIGKSFFTLLFLVSLMFYRDWKLTLAAFIVFPLLSFFVIYIGKRLRKLSKNIQHELGSLSDLLSQTFQGIRLIKAYNMEDHERTRVGKAVDSVRDLNIKSVQLRNLSTPVNEILVGFVLSGIIVYGGYEVIAGNTTAGSLASFLAAFIMAYEPMKKLAKLNNSLQVGLGASDRVFTMLDTEPTLIDKDDDVSLGSEAPDIYFRDVDFSYEGTELKALNSISFTAPAGKVTALVGHSGSGKSTIMNLIPRFYDVSGGSIVIGDHDLRDLGMHSLRSNIALVSQDNMIFNDSVFQNIHYGRPQATAADVYEAAKAAAAHDFIEEFEEGYDTVVGENGVKLSGGQKQRISIARAILRDAPILLLDEATSALDNESEKLVKDALHTLEKGRTTLVIAHRLTTVKEADQILVLDRGKIVEQGTHDELLVQKGVYAHMYNTGLRE